MERIDNPMASIDHSDDLQCKTDKLIESAIRAYKQMQDELIDMQNEYDDIKHAFLGCKFLNLDYKTKILTDYDTKISGHKQLASEIKENLLSKGVHVE